MYLASYFFGSFWNIVLIILVVSLYRRTSRLEERISKFEKGEKVFSNPAPVATPVSNFAGESVHVTQNPMQEYSAYATAEVKPSTYNYPEESSEVSDWFKDNLLLKVGVLMIIVGFGWFVSYAFAHDWIGPVGRITLGVVLGTLVTLFGTFRLKVNQLQGRALTVLGTALIIVSILAGEYYYNFFTSTVVLVLVFIISLYVTLTSAGYDDEKLAVYGIVMSLFAPYFSHSSNMDKLVLFFYLALASIAAIWVTVIKKWKSVTMVGLTGVLLYTIGYIFSVHVSTLEQRYVLLMLGYGISFIYMIINIWGMINHSEDTGSEDVYLSAINTFLILGYTTKIVPTVYQSLTLVVWMLVFAFTGFFVFMKTRSNKLFYIHAGIAVLFLGVATSIELSGPTLVIAFAIESAILVFASYIVTNSAKVAEYMSFVFILPVMMSVQSLYSSKWDMGIFHSDFVVLFLLAVILGVLGLFFKMNEAESDSDLKIHQVAYIVSSVYAFALVWLVNHSIILNDDTAVFISLFIYTIVGLGTHFYGLFNGSNPLRKYGMTLLVLVVIRLVLVDVWNMDLVLRVITFIVLGVMFMSSAFISKKQNTIQ